MKVTGRPGQTHHPEAMRVQTRGEKGDVTTQHPSLTIASTWHLVDAWITKGRTMTRGEPRRQHEAVGRQQG